MEEQEIKDVQEAIDRDEELLDYLGLVDGYEADAEYERAMDRIFGNKMKLRKAGVLCEF